AWKGTPQPSAGRVSEDVAPICPWFICAQLVTATAVVFLTIAVSFDSELSGYVRLTGPVSLCLLWPTLFWLAAVRRTTACKGFPMTAWTITEDHLRYAILSLGVLAACE